MSYDKPTPPLPPRKPWMPPIFRSVREFVGLRIKPRPVKFAPAEPRAYRGSDNPKARKPVSRASGPMVLMHRMQVPADQRPALLPGRKSRRERTGVWVPASDFEGVFEREQSRRDIAR